MSNLKIVNVGEIVTGKSENGYEYEYFPVEFSAGFGLRSTVRNIFKDQKAGWNRGTKEQAEQMKKAGANISGKKVTMDVEPFTIVDEKTGEERTVTTYSTIVFDDENAETVFKSNGRIPVKKQAEPVVVASDEKVGQEQAQTA